MFVRIGGLDGLRALACLLVIAHHSKMPGFSGGWLGVDVFFPLSGYLITTLLLQERQHSGCIHLGRFYLRRAARLYPALLLTCGVVGLAYLLGAASALRPLVDLAGAATYTSDFLCASGRCGGLLSHTWSLAVEEQFYVLWPLALVLLRARLAAVLAVAAAAISLAAAATMSAWEGGLGQVSYFAPQTRIWELMAGCLVAFVPPVRSTLVRRSFSVLAVALTTEAVAAGAPGGYPQMWQVVLVVVATAGLLTCAPLPARLAGWLDMPVLRWIGQRSYGLYLFHYPLILLIAGTSMREPLRTFVAIALTFGLTAASHRWLEEPIRAAARRRVQSPAAARSPIRPT